MKKSCKLSAKYCFVFALLSAWTAFLFMIPGCDKVNLAGVVTPYHNRLLQEDKLQLQLEKRTPSHLKIAQIFSLGPSRTSDPNPLVIQG